MKILDSIVSSDYYDISRISINNSIGYGLVIKGHEKPVIYYTMVEGQVKDVLHEKLFNSLDHRIAKLIVNEITALEKIVCKKFGCDTVPSIKDRLQGIKK